MNIGSKAFEIFLLVSLKELHIYANCLYFISQKVLIPLYFVHQFTYSSSVFLFIGF